MQKSLIMVFKNLEVFGNYFGMLCFTSPNFFFKFYFVLTGGSQGLNELAPVCQIYCQKTPSQNILRKYSCYFRSIHTKRKMKKFSFEEIAHDLHEFDFAELTPSVAIFLENDVFSQISCTLGVSSAKIEFM